METNQDLIERIAQLELLQPQQSLDLGPRELMRIICFEVRGTALFAYGIINSQGSDFMISAALFAGIFISSKFSGGHLNPAVTFSFYSSDKISTFTMRVYWMSQFGGVFLGAFIAQLILNQAASPHIPTQPFEWILADFFGETLGTFLFVLFIHIQVHKETQFTDNDVLGIAIIAAALYFGRMSTPHSGGCLNPAIGVGLEIVKSFEVGLDRLSNVWVFIFAPLLGAQLASEFYRNIYAQFYPKK